MSATVKRRYEELKKLILHRVDEDKERMTLLYSELVRRNTADPPGDTREAMVVVERFMAETGLPYKILGVNDTIPNMISSVRFSDKGRHLMLNGHLDTMPAGEEPGWNDDPWSGKIADGKVWGRGAGDMKGGVTAMLFAYSPRIAFRCYVSIVYQLRYMSELIHRVINLKTEDFGNEK